MKPPAFQFYADDFIAGVADMTQNEVGAYIMLLAHGWNTQGLRADDFDRLKILAKGDISKHVLGKFKLKNGKLFNARQEKERKKQLEFRNKQRGNGAKGGRPKKEPKHNPSLLSGETQGEAKKSSPSPVSSLLSPDIKEDREKGGSLDVELPLGFPKTEAEAKAIVGTIGCTEAFALETWNKAMGRHGRDAKDVPIRSWPHYLKSEMNFNTSRLAREKATPNGFRAGKPSAKPDHEGGF